MLSKKKDESEITFTFLHFKRLVLQIFLTFKDRDWKAPSVGAFAFKRCSNPNTHWVNLELAKAKVGGDVREHVLSFVVPVLLEALTNSFSFFSKYNGIILGMPSGNVLGLVNCEQTCLHCCTAQRSTDKP